MPFHFCGGLAPMSQQSPHLTEMICCVLHMFTRTSHLCWLQPNSLSYKIYQQGQRREREMFIKRFVQTVAQNLLLRFELFFFFFTLCKYKVQNNLGMYSAVLYIHRQYSTYVIYCNLLLIITTNLLCEKHRP